MIDEKDLDKVDMKHARVGHIDLGRDCDRLVLLASAMLPGQCLPKRWRYVNRDSFQKRYGDLGTVVWAKTASYHMLILDGVRILRIWTDSPSSTLVDLHDDLAARLQEKTSLDVMDIPKSSRKKTKPFIKRIKLEGYRPKALLYVLLSAMKVFGVTRVHLQ